MCARRLFQGGNFHPLSLFNKLARGSFSEKHQIRVDRQVSESLGPKMHSRDQNLVRAIQRTNNASKGTDLEQDVLMKRMLLYLQHIQSPALQFILHEWTKQAFMIDHDYQENWKFSTRGVYCHGSVVFPTVGVLVRGRFYGTSYEQDLDVSNVTLHNKMIGSLHSKWPYNSQKHLNFKDFGDEHQESYAMRFAREKRDTDLWTDDSWMEAQQWHLAAEGEPFEVVEGRIECRLYDMSKVKHLNDLFIVEDEDEDLIFPLYSKFVDCYPDDAVIQWPKPDHIRELVARLMNVVPSWKIPGFDPRTQELNIPTPVLVWFVVRLLFPQTSVCQRMLSGPISDDFNITPLAAGEEMIESFVMNPRKEQHSPWDGIRSHEYSGFQGALQSVDQALRKHVCMRKIPPAIPGIEPYGFGSRAAELESDRPHVLDELDVMPPIEKEPSPLDGRVLVYPRPFRTVVGSKTCFHGPQVGLHAPAWEGTRVKPHNRWTNMPGAGRHRFSSNNIVSSKKGT